MPELLPQAIEYEVTQEHINHSLLVENYRQNIRGIFRDINNDAVCRGDYCPNALALHDVLLKYFPGKHVTEINCGDHSFSFRINDIIHHYTLGSNSKLLVKKFDGHVIHGHNKPQPKKCTAFFES